MAFARGDKVEVCIKEEGFHGSYYAATVVSRLPNDLYVVRYDRLLDDHGRADEPLVETVRARELRPAPPDVSPPRAEFALLDAVDAFDNDGWWAGVISGEINGSDRSYPVYFDSTGDEIAYPVSRLRPHLDWVRAKWVSPKKKNNDKAKTKRAVIIGERLQRKLSSNSGVGP